MGKSEKKSVVQYIAPIEKTIIPTLLLQIPFSTLSHSRTNLRLKGILLSISLLRVISTRGEYSKALIQ